MSTRVIGTAAAVLAAAVAVGAGALSASAITGGQPDGQAHPNVALIAFYDGAGRYRCTATLVSPTVLLTAGHCTDGTVGKTAVTFQTFLAETGPSPLPVAADPAVGYTSAEVEAGGYLAGAARTHPQYSGFTDQRNWNDVGVIVLDRPVANPAPAPVASLGHLDRLGQPALNGALFTSVGFGTEVRKPDSGPQKPTPMSYPLLRRYAESPGQRLTPQILQVNGNDKDNRGTGGTCFGDSGGPTFHGGAVVAVVSFGRNQTCRYLDGLQRVDIKPVQDWLATFGVRPG